jgi:hypothetical protein
MIRMRFGFFLRVPWWLVAIVFIGELAAWIVAGTLWLIFIGLPRALMRAPRDIGVAFANIRKPYDKHLAQSVGNLGQAMKARRLAPPKPRPDDGIDLGKRF